MVDYQLPKITRTVTVILIIHAVFFLLSLVIPRIIFGYFGLYWSDMPVFNLTLVYRIFTYPFVLFRVEIFGLLFFALFMWWVGSGLERSWGTRQFITFYCVTVSVSGLLCLPVIHLTGVHMGYIAGTIGITFSIIAVYAYLTPNTPFYVFGIFPIKVKWLLLVSLLFIIMEPTPSSMLYHLIIQLVTGLVAVMYVFFTQPIPVWVRPVLGGVKKGLRRIKSDIRYKLGKKKITFYRYRSPEEEEPDSPAGSSSNDETFEQKEVNRILDKISREGLDALTKEEKQFLDIVSENMRNNNMDN
ncbi:MAG: rhomboid family intramembrane serine protease [Spirochaetales bacterium]|nr:rhomboid family intramembrane serine protease [Spirochaetales bacterium]